MSRVFYGLTFAEAEAVDCLRSIRYLLQPDRIRTPHITVRGPTSRRLSQSQIDGLAEQIEGTWVQVTGPGGFRLGEYGYVLFLRCFSHHLWRVWRKPDFAGQLATVEPHITLFEGRSTQVVGGMREALTGAPWNGQLRIERLVELTRAESLDERERLVEALSQLGHTLDSVQKVPHRDRLDLATELVDRMRAAISLRR